MMSGGKTATKKMSGGKTYKSGGKVTTLKKKNLGGTNGDNPKVSRDKKITAAVEGNCKPGDLNCGPKGTRPAKGFMKRVGQSVKAAFSPGRIKTRRV